MEKKGFCERVKNVYPNEDLDNITISYRLNNFIEACNIDLDGAVCAKKGSDAVIFRFDDDSYVMLAMTNNNEDGKKHNIIEAQYETLKVNYYDSFSPSILKKGYSQIPVDIAIEKLVKDCISYKLRIVSTYPSIIAFSMVRCDYREEPIRTYDYTYQCSITGFNDVLSLISQFIKDPQAFYEQKLAIIKTMKIRLNAKQTDELIGDNNNYHEPSEKGMLKKAIGTLFDRHKKQ